MANEEVKEGKIPKRTITIYGDKHNIEFVTQGYESHNAVMVDLQIAIQTVGKAMVDSSKARIILPGGPISGRSN